MGSEWLQVRAATSRSLWCCQAFKETMADIARRWRELHAKEDQLKTYMEKSMRRLKVRLPLISSSDVTLSHSATFSPPPGRQSWASTCVQASLEPGGVRNRTGRAWGCVLQMWKALIALGQQRACPAPA